MKLVENKKLHMTSGEQEINLIHIEDLVCAIELLIVKESPPTKDNFNYFTIAGNEVVQVRDLPYLISNALGMHWGKKQIIYDLPSRENEIWYFKPMYNRLPNWEPRITIETGIRTLVWDKS